MYRRAENQFPLGTQLHRSKHKHVLTGFPFLSFMYYLFNPPLCVLSLFLFSKERKSCHNLTGYVIIVKFMLFCDLETSCSMAHLIKHLKQNCVGP